uniref:Aa_trans domain-containing protein n=1 Tax=Angiostrongylus cantonensis TaxID=6313 RepID=A0A0K0DJQ1_ANGCA
LTGLSSMLPIIHIFAILTLIRIVFITFLFSISLRFFHNAKFHRYCHAENFESVNIWVQRRYLSCNRLVCLFDVRVNFQVLPLENKMRSPQHMVGCCGVISTTVLFVGIIYVCTGILGYVTYGERILGSITLNLTNSPLDLSVKVMLMVMTYCGYLIPYYPVVEMIWISIEPHLHRVNRCVKSALNLSLRYTVVILSFALAYWIPNFKEIIPFIGVTTGMMSALVFPALLECIVFFDDWKRDSIAKLVYNTTIDVVYIVLGLLFIAVGTYTNYRMISS